MVRLLHHLLELTAELAEMVGEEEAGLAECLQLAEPAEPDAS